MTPSRARTGGTARPPAPVPPVLAREGVAAPGSEAELAEAVRAANGPLRVLGGGSKAGWGNPVAGTALSVAGLSGITLYEPGALTLVAQAGTPLAEVQAALAAEGQMLPFEPPDFRAVMGRSGAPTIGGAVAVNAAGPRRVRAGACRDSLIGVRFVTGAGEVVANGGRVMKNVTGYDLVKLMAGSFGTLGVLSEVSFKLLPAPEAVTVLSIEGLADAAAVAVMARALGTPFEVSGAAHLPVGTDGAPVTMLRLEGLDASVAYRAGRLAALLADAGGIAVESDHARCVAVWEHVRDLRAFDGHAGDLWRVALRPSDAPAAAAAAAPLRHLYDHGGATVWMLAEPGTDLRARLAGVAGHATLVRAAPETRARLGAFPPEPAPVAALSAGLRAKFDPRGILNAGLMG